MSIVVSVVMPAYNSEKYIAKSVKSVLDQTFGNFELIIVDDCSTDKTYDVIKELLEKDSRIRCCKMKKNSGVAAVRNFGMSLARGEWVALIDSDDIWYPEKLDKQLETAKNENADLVYCSYAITDEKGKKLCEDFIVPEETDYEKFLVKSVISCSTALINKKICQKYSFSPDLYHEDYAFWLDILKDGNKAVGNVDVEAQYCIRGDSRSSGKMKCAYHRWKIYRTHQKLSFCKSFGLMWGYATEGFKKYKKIKA